MDSISPASRDLARRLLAKESARGKNSGAGGTALPPAVRVCEKIRTVLTTFAGVAGSRSLLARAVTLAAARAPGLKGVTVMPDGSLSGVERVDNGKIGSGKKGVAGGWEEVLVAQLLDLLVTFVGEGLMLQLVRQAWPDLPAGELRSISERET
jgi:hypothetical protein